MIRLSLAYLLAFVANLNELFDQDVVKGLVFIAFAQGNIGHVDVVETFRGQFDTLEDIPPIEAVRPLRPHKIALSLGLPRETVRRKSAELVDERMLFKTRRGLVVFGELAASQRILAAIRANTLLVLKLHAGLAEAGLAEPLSQGADPDQLPQRAIARLAMGYFLRCMEEIRQLFDGDILTGLIYLAVVDANTRHLIGAAGARYSGLNDHVPDDLRQPISALALAARLGLPRETVRRHVRKLEALGAIRSEREGLIVPQEVMRWPAMVEATARNAANVRLLLRQLREAGFPPEA